MLSSSLSYAKRCSHRTSRLLGLSGQFSSSIMFLNSSLTNRLLLGRQLSPFSIMSSHTSSSLTASFHSDATREQATDVLVPNEPFVNRRQKPKVDDIAREKLQYMNYRNLQKIATALHIPARMTRDQLVDKIISVQASRKKQQQQQQLHSEGEDPAALTEVSTTIGSDAATSDLDSSAERNSKKDNDLVMSMYKDSIISQGFFNSLELHEIKFIAKKINISESLSKRETVRVIREDLKLSTEDVLNILDLLPRRPRPRRKDSIFDEDMFYPDTLGKDHADESENGSLLSDSDSEQEDLSGRAKDGSGTDGQTPASSSSSSRRRKSPKVAVSMAGDHKVVKMEEDPSVKAFKQFLKMKKRQQTQKSNNANTNASDSELDYEEGNGSVERYSEGMEAKLSADNTGDSQSQSPSQSKPLKPKKVKKNQNTKTYQLQYSIEEAGRFLTFLLETDIHAMGQTTEQHSDTQTMMMRKPSKELLSIYHCIIDDALLLYDSLNNANNSSAAAGQETLESTAHHNATNVQSKPQILRIQRSPIISSASASATKSTIEGADKDKSMSMSSSSVAATHTSKYPMNVVGDLAGHYHNLLHILSESMTGFPSTANPYIFMGNIFSPPLKTTTSSAASLPFAKIPIDQAVLANSLTLARQLLHPTFGLQVNQLNGFKCFFALLFLKLTLPQSIHLLRSDETLVHLMMMKQWLEREKEPLEIKLKREKKEKRLQKQKEKQEQKNLKNSDAVRQDMDDGSVDEIHEQDRLLDSLWSKTYQLYEKMPIAAVLDDSVFIAQGGLGIHTARLDVKEIENCEDPELVMKELILADPARTEEEQDMILTPRKVKVEQDFKRKGRGKPKAMDRFQGFYVDSRSLNGFLRRNHLDMIVRSSKSFLYHGFESDNEGRLISLYSCPHVVVKDASKDIDGNQQVVEESAETTMVENTGAVLRFDKPKTTDFQIVPFLSRLDDDSNIHDTANSQVFY